MDENSQEKNQIEKEEEVPRILLDDDIEDKRKLIVVLEQAPLLTAKFQHKVVLLNSDDHKHYITNTLKQNYASFRPDITHHCLLSLFDSPLNKRGLLKVYIKTASNVIIDIDPSCRIPRTFNRFSSLIAQTLTKLRVRAVESSQTLLKVIKNPITDHLPLESLKIGTSTQAKLTAPKTYFSKKVGNGPIVVVVGAVSHGNPGMEAEYIDECICISKYSLSAGYCLNRIINSFEEIWSVK